MAFAKAKLTRFNEISSSTPAPGSYNPNFCKKNPTTPTAERNENVRSPTGSVISEKGSVKSATSTPNFRTPILPVRRKLLCSQSARKYTSKESNKHIDSIREELKEKLVECVNKTQCIRELEAQIDELKEKLNNLTQINNEANTDDHFNQIIDEKNKEIAKLIEEKSKLEQQLENTQKDKNRIEELEEIIVQKNLEIRQLIINKDAEINSLLEEKDILQFEYEEKRLHLESLLLETEENVYDLKSENDELIVYNTELQRKIKNKILLQKRIAQLLKKIKAKQKTVSYLQKRIIRIKNEICDVKTETQNQISTLQQELHAMELKKTKEIEETEHNFLSIINDLNTKIDNLENDHRKEVSQVQDEANEQIRLLKTKLDEMVMLHDIEKNDLNLRLSDTERDLQYALDSKKQLTIDLNQKKCILNEIQRKLTSTLIELNDTKEYYAKEIKSLNLEIDNINTQKRRYVIALDETRSTVDVLKKRLVESDQGVEQLKSELNNLEKINMKLENDNIHLKENIIKLENENKLLAAQNFSGVDIIQEVEKQKRYLTDAVENYKQLVVNTFQENEQKVIHFTETLNEIQQKYGQLQQKYNDFEQASIQKITQLETENETLLAQLTTLETQKENLIKCNREVVDDLNSNKNKVLEALSLVNASKIEMERQDAENTELKFKINRLEAQVASLQVVANEKRKHTDETAKDTTKYKEILEKYNILLTNIKAERKEKEELQNKINAQNKLIEKLKHDLNSPKVRKNKRLSSTNKENESPVKNNGTLRGENQNITPLKEKNVIA